MCFKFPYRLLRVILQSLTVAVFSALPVFGQEPQPLALNQSVEKSLSFGQAQSHSYTINATAGQFLQLQIEQKAADIAAKLIAPDGKTLADVDDTSTIGDAETVSIITETAGVYRLEIRLANEKAKAGNYIVTLLALRAPLAKDRSLIAAQKVTAEADVFFDQKAPAERKKAVPKYEDAYKLWLEAEDKSEAAGMMIQLGLLQSQLNDPQSAIEAFNKALPLLRETKDRQREASTLNGIGVNLNNSGEFRKALVSFEQTLSLYRALRNKRGEGSALNSLGETYRRLGEKRKALKFFEEALSIRREIGDRAGEAISLNSLGAVNFDLGEMQKALDYYNQSLPLRRAAKDKPGEAITLNNIGRAFDVLGAQREAITNYEQALQIAKEANARNTEAQTLNYMGLAHWSAQEYPQAIQRLEQALVISREAKNPALESAVLNNLGLVYNATGEWKKAIESLNQSLPLTQQTGNVQYQAYVLNNQGFAHEGLGEKEEALKAHTQALELARKVRDTQREAKIRYGIARIESSRNRLKQAREQIEKTVKIAESARSKLASPELRADYRASVQRYYDLYIDVLMRMGKRVPKSGLIGEALQVSERARARSLIELLAESNADIRQGVDPALVDRERELQELINEKTTEQIRLLGSRARAEQVAELGKEIEQLNAELRTTQAEIRSRSPRYAALTQPQSLTLPEIQKQTLNPWSLLLEYSLGEERSYLWVVGQNSIRSFTLPKRSIIEAAAKRFYDAATARNQFIPRESNQQKLNRIADADAEIPKAAAALSRLILSPAAPLLGNKRLIVVADGALQYIPFAALPVNPQSNSRLISRHEIVSLPSATTLTALRSESAHQAKAAKTVAVIADPVFEAKDERVKIVPIKAAENQAANIPEKKGDKSAATVESEPSRILLYKTAKDSGATDQELRIPRLPNTRKEAETILSLTKADAGKSVFDFAANRAAATSDDLGQYRILHFATHGFLNSLNPELSGLVMSLVNEQGKPQNGYLLAPEIYNLKLPATELVVLSACQTGLGKEIRGEGIVGLTRGFMYAGAPRVAVSLWSVNDRSTADLMKHFYEAMLAKGQRPAEALRSAQLELLKQKQWQSPYYWAAFELQGEWK
ncbi:MAG: CHAT domain-containing protein [Acidobacteria bacterium]|nr:CHAT domain-containing protein [Acidobacteriota bacterium]